MIRQTARDRGRAHVPSPGRFAAVPSPGERRDRRTISSVRPSRARPCRLTTSPPSPRVKAWLGLPAAPGRTTRRSPRSSPRRAARSYAALGRPGLLPQSLHRDVRLETRRVYPAALAGAAGDVGDCWRGIAIPPGGASATPSASTRLCPAARRRRAARATAGARPLRPVLCGRGRQSLVVDYRAGYAVQGETQTVPAAAPFALAALAPYGPWASDLGVTYAATGAALTAVAAAPAPGSIRASGGVYAFSAGRRRRGGLDRLRLRPAGRGAGGDSNSRPSVSAPPSASASGRSRSAGRRRSPTTRARSRRRCWRCCSPTSGWRSDARRLSILDGVSTTADERAASTRFPAALGAALAAKARDSRRRSPTASGPRSFPAACSNARSGALRNSIAADVSADGDGVVAPGRLERRRQLRGDPGIRRQDRGARDPAGQGDGARLRRRRRAALRPQGRAPGLGHPGTVLPALDARAR